MKCYMFDKYLNLTHSEIITLQNMQARPDFELETYSDLFTEEFLKDQDTYSCSSTNSETFT